ncbi:MAG: phosphoenolpyruvate synthase, partial [Candidatus Omnitrophica bacterium]|nr:phosphoenolpyruvate synthase [Candidatus Omnitrophota bacterium]
MSPATRTIRSGNPSLDDTLLGIHLGDNVVWQVDELEDYRIFAQPFAAQAIRDGFACVYVRFAAHAPILTPQPGLEIIELDPSAGFDPFCSRLHRVIEERGRECHFVFDNISDLVAEWATDELLANFFQVTCPFLFELDTVAFFGLKLGNHQDRAVARIRDTTQILINVYRVGGQKFFHALKVWDRYSSKMFLPHLVSNDGLSPVIFSGEAAAVVARARREPLRLGSESIAPWESIYRRLLQYEGMNEAQLSSDPEFVLLRQEFALMLLGAHPRFMQLVEEYLGLDDLFEIRRRVVGSGRIGGKALGMLLARSILRRHLGPEEYDRIMESHDSFYVGSDVFYTFLVNNDLFRLRLQLTQGESVSHAEFEEIEERFLRGSFPPEVMAQFENMLDYFGQAPIIVRSSSLLEDSFGNAFAGKYRSEFCVNQGTPEQRLETFLRCVRLVYASALNPDALSYRRKRGLAESDEQMALLIQRVSGAPYKRSFFPTLAGVAFSKNLYAWSDRIDRTKGFIRLVFGLGTRAVDRTSSDYPRLISVSHPDLRPEVGNAIARYSQREVDLLDLDGGALVTRTARVVLGGFDYPNQDLFVSLMKDGFVSDPTSLFIDSDADSLVLTFNNLIKRTNFVSLFGRILEVIEKAYCIPLDVEFTAFIGPDREIRINLVQCRPMNLPGTEGVVVDIPREFPEDRVLFRAHRLVCGGVVPEIRYALYIDPLAYANLPHAEEKRGVGRLVGRINRHPSVQHGKCMMLGPGRWGTSHIDLGVSVSY